MKTPDIIKFKRPQKENKTKLLTVRLTPEEHKFLEDLKTELKFESIRELLLYSNDILDQLKNWQRDNYKFLILNKKNKEDIKEVEFDLLSE